ncbi:MAG: hydroxymethylglutaryl-CoA reductase [Ignavibacteriales bacterium]|nr:MAG: hydroxymethylglutaryl-CoA reductase [Ignavibacteriales bacterium]
MPSVTPPRGYKKSDTERRKKWLEERTGIHLNDTGPNEPEDLKGIIENHTGFISIPMAVAGPLLISGTYAKGEFFIPLCTLEGSLSLSMTRGLYLTHLSGGIKTTHIKQEISRSPIFIFEDVNETLPFIIWIKENFDKIKKVAESSTKHGKLLRIDPYPTQNSVILDFIFYTAEAAGQNMVTIAAYEACRFIKDNFKSTNNYRYFIESNFNGDKNPATKTLLLGRSHYVIGSALIRGNYLKRVMRTTAKEYVEGWTKCTHGAQMAGVVGMNMHVANALAAIYLATGQDVACVAENSVAVMTYEVRNETDLYATLTMPSISVGTVGGGTRLKQQNKNLQMLGCIGKNSSKKFAEIVCASALALELSLGGAIVTDEFAQAHAKYGRK